MTLVCDLSAILVFFFHMPAFFLMTLTGFMRPVRPYTLCKRDFITERFVMLFEMNKKEKKFSSKD